MAKSIVDKYPDQFVGIDTSLIRCYAIVNKDRKETNPKVFDLHAVKMPIRLDCPYSFYAVIHLSDWSVMEEKHKLLLISQILTAIMVDENGDMIEEKVKSFDMKDFATMLRTFGTDYLVKDDVPHILEEEIKWID